MGFGVPSKNIFGVLLVFWGINIAFLVWLWYCMSDVNVRKLRRKVMGNLKMAESLVAVHTHTHTLLLNEKINKFDIEKATRLSILY